MLSDIIRATTNTMENGEKSRSSFTRPKGFLRSLFSPAPATTRRDTNRRLRRFLGFSVAALAAVAFSAFAQTQSQQPAQQQPQQPPSQSPIPSPAPPPPQQSGQQPPNQKRAITVSVDLVVLHATVVDDRGTFVEDLKPANFRIFEDKVEQKLDVFSRQDVPVSMGLVVDNSGSMRAKRPQVNAAALTFVKTSNPQDEAFVVNFNDEYYLDTEHDFTSDQQELNEALSRIDSRGSTALYDAIVGSLGHLKKAHKDKRVLLVITDGEDDASRMTFDQTVKA